MPNKCATAFGQATKGSEIGIASIGKRVDYGATQLTEIPLPPTSPAALLLKPMTACLVAEYALFLGCPTSLAVFAAFIIAPLPLNILNRALIQSNSPVKYVLVTNPHSSSLNCVRSWTSKFLPSTPAMLATLSRHSKCETVFSIQESILWRFAHVHGGG